MEGGRFWRWKRLFMNFGKTVSRIEKSWIAKLYLKIYAKYPRNQIFGFLFLSATWKLTPLCPKHVVIFLNWNILFFLILTWFQKIPWCPMETKVKISAFWKNRWIEKITRATFVRHCKETKKVKFKKFVLDTM